jgi:hypothetical protein
VFAVYGVAVQYASCIIYRSQFHSHYCVLRFILLLGPEYIFCASCKTLTYDKNALNKSYRDS